MKIAVAFVVAAATLSGVPLLAQQDDAVAQPDDSTKVTYAPAAGGFGDQAASHAWEMSAVTGELEGKLDSKTAKVGDRVVVKTTDKVQSSDGMVIPRGSRLVGHVTEAQAYSVEVGPARISVAFDRAELKNGQSIAVYTLVRGVSSTDSGSAAGPMNDGMMNMPLSSDGGIGNGQGSGYGRNGAGLDRGPAAAGGIAGGTLNRGADAAAQANEGADATTGAAMNTAPQGTGSLSADTGAHGVAAARAVPRATQIPGVMLAGNSSSSGVLLGSRKDIQLESGTQIQLGVAANR